MCELRLFFNPLDSSSKETHQLKPGTLLIDFLVENYPHGFDGGLATFIGNEYLPVEDLDYPVNENDCVTMLVMPMGAEFAATYLTAEFLMPILIQATIGLVIGFTINLLFGPEAPNIGKGEDSPVYSINPTRNRSRLGEPITAHYGTVSFPPDYAAAPYTYYVEDSNDQFIDELLCLGQGDYTVDQITVGDTPIDILAPGIVQFWLYGPDDHNQTLGVIEADVNAKVANASNASKFWENVYTSPEIDTYEFNDSVNDPVLVPVPITGGNAFASTVDPSTGDYTLGRIVGIPDTTLITEGDVLTFASTLNNNGDMVAGAVRNNGDGTLTVWERWVDQGRVAQENPLNGTVTVNAVVNPMVAGPYRTQKTGQEINEASCDIVFPQGLMDIDADGDQNYKRVDMVFTFQRIDPADGSPIDPPIVVNKSWRYKQRRAVRATVSSGPLTPGSYEVTIERTTPFASAGRDVETTLLTGIKGHVVLDTT
ncbi:MAG: hypothetical protein QNJ71_10200, partial [Acidimicrobiia bacterium]|nr:hypothetical protein [Acidimicrobiia bacterium]